MTILAKVLASARSSPLSSLFKFARVVPGVPCSARFRPADSNGGPYRYDTDAGPDPCYAPAHRFFTNKTVAPSWFKVGGGNTSWPFDAPLLQRAAINTGLFVGLDLYHGQTNGTSSALASCRCLPTSSVCESAIKQGSCGSNSTCGRNLKNVSMAGIESSHTTESRQASQDTFYNNPISSHVPDAGLLCNEAKFDFLSEMVSTLKHGSLRALQQVDGLQNRSCASRGFNISFGNGRADHCYPAATIWFKGEELSLYKAQQLEVGVTAAYDISYNLPEGTGMKRATCDCLPGSEVQKGLPKGYCS